jgi:hypothetical protein
VNCVVPDGPQADGLRLRYFTPKEIANLHSFPPEVRPGDKGRDGVGGGVA